MIAQAMETFGRSAFDHNLFATSETAIRFELAHGNTRIERFDTALYRASTLARDVFRDSERLCVSLMYYGDTLGDAKRVIRSLKDCEVSIARPYAVDQQVDEDFSGETQTRVFFESDLDNVHRMIWGTIARELGIHPCLSCGLYIFDPELGILMHPYDDRGMDILGPNRERIRAVYTRYFDWLLEYNLAEMQVRYGAA